MPSKTLFIILVKCNLLKTGIFLQEMINAYHPHIAVLNVAPEKPAYSF